MKKEELDRYRIRDYYMIPTEIVDNVFYEFETQLKKQQEINEKAIDFIKNGDLLYFANKNSVVYRDNVEIKAVADRLNDLLEILEDKEV